MFGAVMRMERKKENHGRSPTQLRKYEKQSTGLSFNNVQPRYNLDLSARSDVLTYTKENQIKISSGKGVAIIQRMRNNVVQRCDPSGFANEPNCGTDPNKKQDDTLASNAGGDTYSKDFEDLANYREQQGMPAAGSANDKDTAAKLIIGDHVYYGKNGHGKQNEIKDVFNVNAQTATHAEADVFYQAKVAGNTGTTAVLVTDRRACKACGYNGGIRSMAKQLGITDLTIVSPGYNPINFNPQKKPLPNPFG